MKGLMAFRPDEVLFSATNRCNLACPHCDIPRSGAALSRRLAERFLAGCKAAGVKKVGFTGGEPFLAPGFLAGVIRAAVREGLAFDRIMTNGVWWKSRRELEHALARILAAGYDGDLCVSVDAFHRQDLRKAAFFTLTAAALWRRPDIVSIAYVAGGREGRTRARLQKFAALLGGHMRGFGTRHGSIGGGNIFVRLLKIELSAAGRAERLKRAWDGRWFREDYCKGPGNVLFVLPDGTVKPCCGYATGADRLTIGTIRRDTAVVIAGKVRANRFVSTVFCSGLSSIRKRLERSGFVFPGKTTDHCFLCHHILTKVPGALLDRCLDA